MGHHDLCLVSCILFLYPVLHNPPLVFLLFIWSHLQRVLVPLNTVDVARCRVLSTCSLVVSRARDAFWWA